MVMATSALAGQVALVTGGGRGIGRAVARALAAEGATVVIAARTRRELADVATEIREAGGAALAVPTDVISETAVEALAEQTSGELGRLDILVTAAGVGTFGPFVGTKPADWDPMLAVNLRGAMLCCRAVLPGMQRQRRGTIINVASIAATRAIPGAAVYAATKAAIVAFSRVLAEEHRADGIRVGVILPGAVDTALWDPIPNAPDRGRMLRPDDVARGVILMATQPPHAALEEVTLMPAGGIL
jgi:NADP-dependent 3-hydroxy acid dehydrogenase YdfG